GIRHLSLPSCHTCPPPTIPRPSRGQCPRRRQHPQIAINTIALGHHTAAARCPAVASPSSRIVPVDLASAPPSDASVGSIRNSLRSEEGRVGEGGGAPWGAG